MLIFQFDFENRIHGANFLAYPPVVAGGNRANTLHYINNNQIIKVKKGFECANASVLSQKMHPRSTTSILKSVYVYTLMM